MSDLGGGGNGHNSRANASFYERKCLTKDDKTPKKAYWEIPQKVHFLSDRMVIRKAFRKSRGEKYEQDLQTCLEQSKKRLGSDF